MTRALLSIPLALLAPALDARQCPPGSSYPPENATPWSYVAPPLTGNCLQTYRLFLPTTPRPPEGYPVVIYTDFASFQSVTDVTQVSTSSHGWLLQLLENGIAVVAARMTVSIPFQTAQHLADWTTLCGFVPPTIPGHGMFHPPGVMPPDMDALGATVPPYADPAYAMPEKDAVMVIQHVRHLARGTGPLVTEQQQKMALLDHRRIAVWGSSAGSIAFSWPALGPDRRFQAPFAGLGGQYAEATRVDAAILGWNQIWLPMWTSTTMPVPYMHWGLGGDSEVPAGNMGLASPGEVLANSPLYYERCELNDELPLYTYTLQTSLSTDYVKNYAGCPGTPFCFDGQGTEVHIHPTWNQITLAKMYPQTKVAAMDAATSIELDMAGVPHETVTGLVELGCKIGPWLAGVFAPPPDPWTIIEDANLGLSQPCQRVSIDGTHGEPRITATGSMFAGQPYSLQLSNARESSSGWLLFGTDAALAPALGGVIVPDPVTGGALPITTDASGKYSLRPNWPAVPSGYTVFAQFFVLDLDADFDVSATAAAYGVSP